MTAFAPTSHLGDRDTCIHCGTELAVTARSAFCCAGCEHVYELLKGESLGLFYELGGGRSSPVDAPAARKRDHKWIEALEARRSRISHQPIDLDIQGVHCAGCVWLLEELFRRHAGAGRVVVNPTLGRVTLAVTDAFSLESYVTDVERFGYRLGPPLKAHEARASNLLLRFGICLALAMNAMIFSIAIYAGLREGPLFQLFQSIVLALSTLSLLVGGPVFFRAAWQGLRRGVAHLDLPIALGLLFAFAGSVYSFVYRRGEGSYFDTLNVFIALMLLGRYLQERVLERNKQLLLASDGADGLFTRRIRAGEVALVPCTDVALGDALLIAPGDLVPVAATPRGHGARFSLDWITGESAIRSYEADETVPAGAFLAGTEAVTLVATESFAGSALLTLLQSPRVGETARANEKPRATPWWQRLARLYVGAVFLTAALGFVFTLARGAGVGMAMDVTTAILVVTCPCAFGIATPLAYELAQSGLRRAGLYVRSPGFLDRATQVTRVVLDKTGTLTTGSLIAHRVWASPGMSEVEMGVLFNMVARSTHPKSAAVKRALGGGFPFRGELAVVEHAGLGLELHEHGVVYRFGALAWSAPAAVMLLPEGIDADVAFSVDGVLRVAYRTVEQLRPNAAEDVRALREAGYEVDLLSGDTELRVREAARIAGIADDHAFGARSPEGKASWLRDRDRGDTLMVGDGINDALVVDAAHCSGTPAVDRPFMPTRADFYFTTAGLAPIRLALAAARELARVTHRNLVIAIVYNLVAVALACTGRMSPLVCAVFMPASSLSVLLLTASSLSRKSHLWKSFLSKSSSA